MTNLRWPVEFLRLADQYADRLDNTMDGSCYFHVSSPHCNVWWNPTLKQWRVKSGLFEKIGSDFGDLGTFLAHREVVLR